MAKITTLVYNLSEEELKIKKFISLLSPRILLIISKQHGTGHIDPQDLEHVSWYPIDVIKFMENNHFQFGTENQVWSMANQFSRAFQKNSQLIETEYEKKGIGRSNVSWHNAKVMIEKRKLLLPKILEELEEKFREENEKLFDSSYVLEELWEEALNPTASFQLQIQDQTSSLLKR